VQLLEVRDRNDRATSDNIISWEKEKETNEQEMLFKLNKLFKTQFPTENIRRVVLAAFDTMVAEVSQGKGGPTRAALEAEGNLAVWKKSEVVRVDWANAQQLWVRRLFAMWDLLGRGNNTVGALDCDDLSELIRVVGAWLEKGGGFGGYEDINKALRTGIGAIAPGTPKDWKARVDARDNLQWGKDVRMRENPRDKDPKKKAPDGTSFHHNIEAHVARYWVRPKEGKESGMQMFRANQNDLCKKIDLLFGLLTGATLSGTTTDTVFVLETFGQQIGVGKQLHPGYYLFPAATIAASLHHTLLEVALSLTLDGAIESYCVGFYTTLAPKGGFPPELKEAQDILRKAEVDPRNRHLVLWYDGKDEGKPVGCILFDKKHEIDSYKRLVEAKGLLTHVKTLPQVPSKTDAAHFIQLMAPKLLAYLPQEFQARRVA
jgi:hypothetical protein